MATARSFSTDKLYSVDQPNVRTRARIPLLEKKTIAFVTRAYVEFGVEHFFGEDWLIPAVYGKLSLGQGLVTSTRAQLG